MKLSASVLLTILVSGLVSGGCSGSYMPTRQKEQRTDINSTAEIITAGAFSNGSASIDKYTVYYENKYYSLSLYEPEEGCYLGANIMSSHIASYDIRKFDEMTQKKHNVYVYNVAFGEAFPENWLLNCIANNKTPYISIEPLINSFIADDALISAVKEYGVFKVPAFVQFSPPPDGSFIPDEFIDFIRRASTAFRENAGNSAIVYTVNSKDVWDAVRYYPGDEYVDWIGINIYEPVNTADELANDSLYKRLDYFYETFQNKKPLAISALAISHYSTNDHIYRTNEAAEKITDIYIRILKDYPRIKLINYIDADYVGSTGTEDADKELNNYSVTENDYVLSAYKKAISAEEFIPWTNGIALKNGDISPQLMKSSYSAYKTQNGIYLSGNTFINELNIKNLYDPKTIQGEKCYSADILEKNGLYRVFINDIEKKIILYPI